MSSDNAKDHNNQDFQLSSLFNVKDKVALITGKLTNSPSLFNAVPQPLTA